MPTVTPPTRSKPEDSQSEVAHSVPLPYVSGDDERLELIERIAGSEAFQKSIRLPILLRYLAACTLAHNRAGLTEQAIGRAVFDKPADFSPTEDSSVRVNVRQLRLRLHEFYQTVGQVERIIIEMPKGGYALAFQSRHITPLPEEPETATVGSAAVLSASTPTGETKTRLSFPARLPWLLTIICLLLAATGWYRWSLAVAAEAPSWPLNQVIEPNRETTVVLADGTYMLRLLGEEEVKLDDYADHHYADKLIPRDATEGELRLFRYLQASQMTSMADAHGAATITELAGSLRKNLIIRSAKELNGHMLATGNFIFVGAKTSNPWSELYEHSLNFQLMEAGFGSFRYIKNRSPLLGEQPVYSVSGTTGFSGDDYATISVVPSTNAPGAVMLIQGLRLEGTEAAVRFLSTQEDRVLMAHKLAEANGGTLPKYFEVLLHAHSVGGSAASMECLAVRALAAPRH